MARLKLLGSVMLAGVCGAGGLARAQVGNVRVIAMRASTGIGSPQAGVGGVFTSFVNRSYPAIADNGDVYFGADANILDPWIFSWVSRGGPAVPVFTQNAPVAEMPGWTYYDMLNSAVMGPEGQLLYIAQVRSTISANVLVLSEAGGPRLVAVEGSDAPGMRYSTLQPAPFREFTSYRSVGNYTAFSATVSTPGIGSGVWVRDAAGTRLVIGTLDGAGSQTPFLSTALAGVTESGKVVFNAEVRGNSPSSRIDAVGVWEQGEVTYLARGGENAPGTGPGVVFDRLTQNSGQATRAIAVSRTGATAIYGELSGPGVTTANDTGVWVSRGSARTLVMREGDLVPGSITGRTLGSAPTLVSINARGSIAFGAGILDPAQPGAALRGVFSDIDGMLRTVAQTNDPAPGVGGTFQTFGQVVMTKGDRTVFFASTGAQLSGQAGVWMRSVSGEVEPVLLPGQIVRLQDGTLFNIGSVDPNLVNFVGNSLVNAREEMVLKVFGVGGQNAILVVAIPGPASASTLVGAGILKLALRRRRVTRGA